MGHNIFIGLVVMSFCLAIQCIAISLLLELLIKLERKGVIRLTLFHVSSVLMAAMLAMMVGNLVQISLWAWVFCLYGEFTLFSEAFYHSVVNFSTLGYGDVVMSEGHRLLGALEAINGVLMFGLTTGFLYTILISLMEKHWKKKIKT